MSVETSQSKTNRIAQTRESLKYEFTDAETLDLSRRLARTHQEKDGLVEGQKQALADFKAQISAQESAISDLSRRIANGYEYRTIECELRYHNPAKGEKTLVRLDTGAVVKTSRMEPYELQEQLFEEEAVTDRLDDVIDSAIEQVNNGALGPNVTLRRAKDRRVGA